MPERSSLPLTEVIADGRWLAQRYDDTNDAIHFRFLDRPAHRATPFLKDSEIANAPIAVFPRVEALEACRALPASPVRFIFHSAYCCSTLLVQAHDIPGVAMGYSEPGILTDVLQLQLAGHDRRRVAAVLDAALHLLARPFAAGEVNVIKPSNVFNPLIRAVLALRPDTRAVLLYAPLDSLVGSIAAKDIEGRAWARELMWKYIRLGQAQRFGLSEEELYRQTDLQVAAMGWLAQHAEFGDLAAGPQVRTLNSETLLENPGQALRALQDHFALRFDANAVANGPIFKRHSKDRTEFDSAKRAADRASRLEIYRREIEMVVEWSRRIAEFANIPAVLPSPLLAHSNGPAF